MIIPPDSIRSSCPLHPLARRLVRRSFSEDGSLACPESVEGAKAGGPLAFFCIIPEECDRYGHSERKGIDILRKKKIKVAR